MLLIRVGQREVAVVVIVVVVVVDAVALLLLVELLVVAELKTQPNRGKSMLAALRARIGVLSL